VRSKVVADNLTRRPRRPLEERVEGRQVVAVEALGEARVSAVPVAAPAHDLEKDAAEARVEGLGGG
jgi:hypothetical protein